MQHLPPGRILCTYKLTGLNADKTIKLAVIGTKAGYATSTGYSAATTTNAKGTLAATTSGTKKVDRILTAKPGTWTPGTNFEY